MSDTYELSDAEKRDLIKLITEGKPLPEKYRFLLFADKREVELVWNGKTREVTTAVLPFQTLEHIDEPRKEKGDWQAELFERQRADLLDAAVAIHATEPSPDCPGARCAFVPQPQHVFDSI